MSSLENEKEMVYVSEGKQAGREESRNTLRFIRWRMCTRKFKEPVLSTECHMLLVRCSKQPRELQIPFC